MTARLEPVREEVTRIAPYNAGLTLEEVQKRYAPLRIAKLGSNENPLGPSPRVADAVADIAALAKFYPDPQGRGLCEALARAFGVGADRIVLGNGSEDLLAVIARTVLRPGDAVATLYPSFPLHEDYAMLMGAHVRRVTVRPDMTIDVDALVAEVSKRPRMVIFSNPMNPVGAWLQPEELEAVIEALYENTLLVVDEAYAEYAKGEDYPSATEMLGERDLPWIVLRTFSKAYGLAGLRIGYGIVGSGALNSFLHRTRTPFNTNAVAQVAAQAALGDRDHLHRTIGLATSERERMRKELTRLGYAVALSKGNFLFFETGGVRSISRKHFCGAVSSSSLGSRTASGASSMSASGRRRRTTSSSPRSPPSCRSPKRRVRTPP